MTLALGIGANTSMFSVVYALLFRSAPFPDSGQLVQAFAVTPKGRDRRSFSVKELDEIRQNATSFASLTAIQFADYAVTEPGRPPERLSGVQASADFFTTFGVQPMLGRAFTAEETQPGRNDAIVLSYQFWQDRFAGASDVLTRTLRLDGQSVRIIGVMPESFDYRMLWRSAQFWRPISFSPDQIERRDYRAFQLMGRLAPGATPARVASELGPLAASLEHDFPEAYQRIRFRAVPLHETLVDSLGRNIVWMLLGLSGFVLLLASANLANLQLARATAGARELAIRAALGASRRRLIMQQLQECVVLAAGGAVLGIFLAWGVNRVLERNAVIGNTPGFSIPINGTVLLITVGVTLVTALLFGLAPAWLATRTDLSTALKAQSRGSTPGRGHHLVRQALIIGEVTLALVLLGGAGVMQRGFSRLLEHASGWDTEHVLTAGLPLTESRFDTDARRRDLYRRLETRLQQLPGVEHAALATSVPLFNYTAERPVLTEGQAPDSSRLPTAYHVMVTSGYFAAMGIDLVAGQAFAPDLTETSPRVVIINESLARQLWPGRSAVGQRLGTMSSSGHADWAEVVGVVRDVDSALSLALPSTRFTVYKPLAHEPWPWAYVVVRASVPATLVDSVRRAVAEVDPDLPAENIATVVQTVDRSHHNLKLAGKILVGFAIVGLLLAAVGIYGVISNLVAQRTAEFGIRLALGAQPGNVLALVLRHGLVLTGVGLVLGLGGAYGLARFLAGLMPRLARPDPLVLTVVALLLLTVALIACLVPARRATKVDPLEALRTE